MRISPCMRVAFNIKSIMEKKYKILFVCLGNICRSPAAEGILKKKLQEAQIDKYVEVDSAGTYDGHAGDLPDNRMRAHAIRRGYNLTHRSRQIKSDDFETFDLILGMDDSNICNLQRLAPDPESLLKIHRTTDFCQNLLHNHIPDPYYSGSDGFELVLDILEDACNGLVNNIKDKINM